MKEKIRDIKMIDVDDWNELIKDTYKRPYNFQQQDGCKERGIFEFFVPGGSDDFENDSIPEIVNGAEMGVSFSSWLSRNPKQKLKNQKYDFELDLWWERNFYPKIQMVANDLYDKGIIKKGKYLINIDW